jgi:ketosteroid isomerase-like protein
MRVRVKRRGHAVSLLEPRGGGRFGDVTAVDVVKRLYQGFSEDDIPTVLDTLGPDIEWIEAAGYIYGGTYRGPDAVVEGVLTRDRLEWDDFVAEPELFISENDQVVTRGWYTGTYKATGKSFTARFVHWYTVIDDKIVRFEQVVDSVKVLDALRPGR